MRSTIGLSLVLLVASATAMAKQAPPAHDQPAPNSKAKSVKAANAAGNRQAQKKQAVHAISRHEARTAAPQTGKLPQPDRLISSVQVIGAREVGVAAWYGGRHLGHRTASGDRLDAVRPTAAHRSLPLNSMVRVTNLGNGRSIICTINDRGPVSHSLLIDVSPRVAEQLDMKRTGVAKVAVEPVAPATGAAQ